MIKSKKKKGAEGVQLLAKTLEEAGYKCLVVPGSGALTNFSGDIQINTSIGKLQGEVKIKKAVADYKLLYQDPQNKLLFKREVGRHTAHAPKKFLVTMEIDLFIQLLKCADEAAGVSNEKT
jgi:hypothetical protein